MPNFYFVRKSGAPPNMVLATFKWLRSSYFEINIKKKFQKIRSLVVEDDALKADCDHFDN